MGEAVGREVVEVVVKATREGSARKRAAVLGAARDLFVEDGYERASVDAIAARAVVSKRTVYDYFGDKAAVFWAVVDAESAALMAAVTAAVEEELEEELEGGVALEAALMAFARRVATQTLFSSPFAVFRRLVVAEAGRVPARTGPPAPAADPEQVLAERFAAYARAGLLDAGDPRRAAEHFSALTFLLALDAAPPGAHVEPALVDPAAVDGVLVDGVRAFLRAYVPR